MKPFMSAQEIADAKLPALPHTKRGVQLKAKRENWESRIRDGQGGGREYAVHCLPQRALSELAFREIATQAVRVNYEDEAFDAYGDVKTSARAAILMIFERFVTGSGLALTQASTEFSQRYNDGALIVRPWIKQAVPSVSARSIRRWQAASKMSGATGLKDRARGPKGKSRFDLDSNLNAYITAQIAGRPHVAATHIYDGICANFADAPSLRSVQLYVRKYRAQNESALLYAANPDQWKSHRRSAMGSLSEDVVRLNQKWEIDGTIADVQCQGPHGKPMRYSLVGLVDVYSRRAKVLVTEQPSAIATAACLRTAFLDWGLPEILKADNGKDYTARHVVTLARDLGITLDYCTPYSPEQKPHVERFLGTLTRGLFKTLPAYTGANVQERQAIRARKSMAQRHSAARTEMFMLSPGELQIIINEWLSDKYERSIHSAIKTTPFQKALGQKTRKVEDMRALDMLLAPPVQGDGIRVVQKKGVSVYGRWFIAPELGGLIGERVSIRLDLEDEGRIVIYSADRVDFICVAEDPSLTGADRREIANNALHAQSAKIKEITTQQKTAIAAHNPDNLVPDILGHAKQKASKVTAIRAPYEEACPPALARAREAAAAIDYPQEPAPLSEEERAMGRQAVKELEAAKAAREAPSLTVISPDPTQRPNFAGGTQGDIDFWKWAQNLKAQGLLDKETAKELREMENNHTMQLLLLTHGVVTESELRARGMYK